MGLVRILGGLPVWMLNEDELWNALLYIDNHVLPCILVDVETECTSCSSLESVAQPPDVKTMR